MLHHKIVMGKVLPHLTKVLLKILNIYTHITRGLGKTSLEAQTSRKGCLVRPALKTMYIWHCSTGLA